MSGKAAPKTCSPHPVKTSEEAWLSLFRRFLSPKSPGLWSAGMHSTMKHWPSSVNLAFTCTFKHGLGGVFWGGSQNVLSKTTNSSQRRVDRFKCVSFVGSFGSQKSPKFRDKCPSKISQKNLSIGTFGLDQNRYRKSLWLFNRIHQLEILDKTSFAFDKTPKKETHTQVFAGFLVSKTNRHP